LIRLVDRTVINMGTLLTVGEAAEILGVSASTIRNWDRAGKLKAVRHPMNNYRLYDRGELQALVNRVVPFLKGDDGGGKSEQSNT
jgi:excisionase family DNA binding protein